MKTVSLRSTGDSSMDVIRERRGIRPRQLLVIAGIIAVAAIAIFSVYSLTHVRRASVVVDRATIITDSVQQGTLVNSVDEAGTLQSESIRIVSGSQAGSIRSVFVRPGAVVAANTPIAQLSNPELDVQAVDAQAVLSVAQAALQSARQQAIAAGLTQRSAVANAGSQLKLAQINLTAESRLYARGLAASSSYQTAKINAAQAQSTVATAKAQVDVDASNQRAKIAAAEADVQKAEAELAAKRAEVSALTILAGGAGVVQTVDAQPGQQLIAGQAIAKVADQRTLKAVLKVPESQVHQVSLGMPATIDAGNGTVTGRVSHIAPSAAGGSVDVDVSFTRPLPPGSRPDLNVDGSIILSRIPNAISIARPAGASDNSEIQLFKVVDGGSRAVKVRVRLGRGSANRMAVVSGLRPGDSVIISDMSSYDSQTEIRLR